MYSKKCVTKKTLDASVKRRALLKLLGVGAITLPVLASHGVAQASKSATHKQGAAFWRLAKWMLLRQFIDGVRIEILRGSPFLPKIYKLFFLVAWLPLAHATCARGSLLCLLSLSRLKKYPLVCL